MEYRNMTAAFVVLSIVLVSDCTQTDTALDMEAVKNACIEKCREQLQAGNDLGNGPCLLNPIPGSDWVCDVAHSPRLPVDNSPENQCSEYREHFVEVTPECSFIRAV